MSEGDNTSTSFRKFQAKSSFTASILTPPPLLLGSTFEFLLVSFYPIVFFALIGKASILVYTAVGQGCFILLFSGFYTLRNAGWFGFAVVISLSKWRTGTSLGRFVTEPLSGLGDADRSSVRRLDSSARLPSNSHTPQAAITSQRRWIVMADAFGDTYKKRRPI